MSDGPGVLKYGELIVLGYNGAENHTIRNGQVEKKHQSKMEVWRRLEGNGIKKSKQLSVTEPSDSQAVKDRNKHTVSYTYSRSQTVIVEYQEDPDTDLFQIGRSSEDQIDFTVVDTHLTTGLDETEGRGGRKPPLSSTISRFACRILTDRAAPFVARVFAAGFDASRNIFLGEKATKWQRKNGEVDGLTTNGILVLHPHFAHEAPDDGAGVPDNKPEIPMYVWREVSVDGDIYTLRETRSAPKRGDLVREETNELQDGSLIDLCGATLLWRTQEGLAKTPSREELELNLDELNAGRPQCPVNLNTLIVPKRRGVRHSPLATYQHSRKQTDTSQAYVYLACGHVQGKHDWGHVTGEGHAKHRCPMCARESERIVQLSLGMEPGFHLDSASLDHAFNPCGHVSSKATVRYWSRIPLPHGTNGFHPVCPFCTSFLATSTPFVKLIFQDHCDD